MLLPNERLALVVVTTVSVASCDAVELDREGVESTPITQGATTEADPTDSVAGSEAMVYEDAQDISILHDTSNLRPPDMDEDDYRRLLQAPAREEFKRTWPNTTFPTQRDVDLLSSSWFVQGEGFVVQNHSQRSFSVAAHFSSSMSSDCGFVVPWKVVGPKASAMFTAHDDRGCLTDRAVLAINDGFGFFVGSTVVERPEALQ
jgi:hypothetical protein